jgi:hypothetical protein
MQTEQIVALLVAERSRLDAAIHVLQGPVKRRGRPPAASAPAVPAVTPVQRKRTMSAAGRKAIADAARRRWAAIKAAKSPTPPVVEQKRALSADARKAMAWRRSMCLSENMSKQIDFAKARRLQGRSFSSAVQELVESLQPLAAPKACRLRSSSGGPAEGEVGLHQVVRLLIERADTETLRQRAVLNEKVRVDPFEIYK